ncbi:MAG: hypothetical protein GY769_15185 [bacterium]|nr:hypothetical protein [bacterium]
MKRNYLLVALAAVLLLPAAGLAQDGPVIWVSLLKAQPGQGEALVQMLVKHDAPLLDRLVEEGAVLEWGVGMPIVHHGNDPYSHAEWVTFADWSGVDKFMAGFMASMQSMSAEERAATEAEWDQNVVPGSHSDAIHRGLRGKPGNGRPAYLRLGYYKVKPGHDSNALELWDKVAAPLYEGLAADGTVMGYGLFTHEVPGDYSWTHGSWYTMPSLATRDAVRAAQAAQAAERSEEELAEIQQSFAEDFEPETHFESIVMVVHYKSAVRPGDE